MTKLKDPRDYKGYGENPPHPQWPGKARVAVQVVLNYEEGGENCVLNGDDRLFHGDAFLKKDLAFCREADFAIDALKECKAELRFQTLH